MNGFYARESYKLWTFIKDSVNSDSFLLGLPFYDEKGEFELKYLTAASIEEIKTSNEGQGTSLLFKINKTHQIFKIINSLHIY